MADINCRVASDIKLREEFSCLIVMMIRLFSNIQISLIIFFSIHKLFYKSSQFDVFYIWN
jgi:hypothetical protein